MKKKKQPEVCCAECKLPTAALWSMRKGKVKVRVCGTCYDNAENMYREQFLKLQKDVKAYNTNLKQQAASLKRFVKRRKKILNPNVAENLLSRAEALVKVNTQLNELLK